MLTPDFKANTEALRIVLEACPDVFNHNVETVPRLYPTVRPQAEYKRSLTVLKKAKELAPNILTKSGLMVGLGETFHEVVEVMKDLKDCGCDILTIGQYLQPKKENLPVVEYIHPDLFEEYKKEAYSIGFKYVASSPLVRSSMNAEQMFSAE